MVYRGWEKLQVCPVWDLKWEACSWPEATMTPTPQQVAKNTRNVALKINQQACSWRGFFLMDTFPGRSSIQRQDWSLYFRHVDEPGQDGVYSLSCSSILRCLLDEHALACSSLPDHCLVCVRPCAWSSALQEKQPRELKYELVIIRPSDGGVVGGQGI